MIKNKKSTILLFILALAILAISFFYGSNLAEKGRENPKGQVSHEMSNPNSSYTSTNIDSLDKFLDFSKYRPLKVKFNFAHYNNSGENKRIAVPGPSYYYLQAILYFDSTTMSNFHNFDLFANYIALNCKKEEFDFEWLPKEVRVELINSKPDYHGHPDFFFGTGDLGKSWYLQNKILIKKGS